MRKAFYRLILTGMLSAGMFSGFAAESRDEKVLRDLKEFGTTQNWIYNDLVKGFELAAATGKPLMVVMRCVP